LLILLGVPPLGGGLQLHYTASFGFVSDSWAFLLLLLQVFTGSLQYTKSQVIVNKWSIAVITLIVLPHGWHS